MICVPIEFTGSSGPLSKVRDESSLHEAVTAAQEAGRKYVTIASRVLNGK